MKKLLIIILVLFSWSAGAVNTCVIADGGGNWNSAGTWTNCGGTYPQTGDSVTATATSGNLLVNVSTNNIKDFDLTNYTGTLGNGTTDQYINMAGTGVLVYPNGFTNLHKRAVVINGTTTITVGSSQTIYLLDVLGTLSLGSNITTFTDGAVYMYNGGNLTTNNYNINTNQFGDHNGVANGCGTLALGSSTITMIGGTPLIKFVNTGSSQVVSANTASIVVNVASGSPATHYFGGVNWNGTSVTFNMPASVVANNTIYDSGNTFANLTINGADSAVTPGYFDFGGNITITGTLTMSGASQVKRPFIRSSVKGTARTITMTGATVTAQDVDLKDLTFAGSPTINSTRVGDCGNNTGGVVSSPKNVYLGGVSGTNYWIGTYWADDSHAGDNYATRAAALSLNNYPLPQDTAYIDNSSFSAASKTLLIGGNNNNPRLSAINASGLTTAATLSFASTSSYPMTGYGSLNLSGSGVTVATGSSSYNVSFDAARANITLTSPSGGWGANYYTIASYGNSVLLGSNFTHTGTFTLTNGTLDLNSRTLTTGVFSSSNSNTRTLQDSAGNAKIVVNGLTGTIFDMGTATNLTVSNSPDIDIGDSDNTLTGNVTFAGGGKTFGDFTVKKHAGDYDTIITGSNTFGALTLETPDASYRYSDLQLTSGTTTTVSALVADGTASYKIGLKSVTGGSAATISDTTGANTVSNMTIQDITVSGATFTANTSTDVSGNSGWIWPSTGIPAGLLMCQ